MTSLKMTKFVGKKNKMVTNDAIKNNQNKKTLVQARDFLFKNLKKYSDF